MSGKDRRSSADPTVCLNKSSFHSCCPYRTKTRPKPDLIPDPAPPGVRHSATETTSTGQGNGRSSIDAENRPGCVIVTRYFPNDDFLLQCKSRLRDGSSKVGRKSTTSVIIACKCNRCWMSLLQKIYTDRLAGLDYCTIPSSVV
jgi:hypothetical protein